jgi:AcrR family transcriptional regulator
MATSTLGRERILAEARDLFLEHGAGGVTMRGLAARIGVTPMALYRHFDNRDDLLAAIVAHGHATFLRYLNRALAEPTPAARLLAAGEQYLAFALEHPRSYAVMFMEHAPLHATPGRTQSWEDAATFRFLVDRIRDAAAAGALQIDDAEDAALTVWAHVHGLVSLFLAGKLAVERKTFTTIYRRSVARLVRGLGGPGPEPPA